MNKKAIKYIIIFLLVPLIVSFVIAIITDNRGFNNKPNTSSYNGIDIPDYNTNDINKQIKRSNSFIYLSVFSLVFISGGVLLYIKAKRGI